MHCVNVFSSWVCIQTLTGQSFADRRSLKQHELHPHDSMRSFTLKPHSLMRRTTMLSSLQKIFIQQEKPQSWTVTQNHGKPSSALGWKVRTIISWYLDEAVVWEKVDLKSMYSIWEVYFAVAATYKSKCWVSVANCLDMCEYSHLRNAYCS